MAELDPHVSMTIDPGTRELVTRVAAKMGVTEAVAIREAIERVENELDRGARGLSARERLRKFWREHPLPPPTGLLADKAFFDELSGDL